MSGDPLAGIAAWVADVMLAFGYVGVALLVALDNVFPPIPSEIILPLAGFLSGQGHLAYPGVVLAATVGSVAGALPLYAVGYWLGEARLRPLVRRFGRWLFIEEADLDQAQEWFDRHGTKAVLLGRCVPLVRSLISIPAGLACMPLRRFVVYTALGSGLWNAILVGIGWTLGERWEQVGSYLKPLEYVVMALLVAATARFLWHRLRSPSGAP
jgi:membrane protein DedA with SNARE-associated domain